jgi:ubiquitin-conjugating enzyme E2 Z
MAFKRLNADIVEIQKELYAEQGIFYQPNPQNIMEGTACILGPSGTPYEGCPMFYTFSFPQTYPFDPPHVSFRTFDGQTRFHPNMYKEGKVCLSILHTWSGPKWASTMRISTILVTLQSLMDTEPLRHEPGYETGKDESVKVYTHVVEKSCIQYCLTLAEKKQYPKGFEDYQEEFLKRFAETINGLPQRIQTIQDKEANLQVSLGNVAYGMRDWIPCAALQEQLVKLKALGTTKSE